MMSMVEGLNGLRSPFRGEVGRSIPQWRLSCETHVPGQASLASA